MVGRTSGHRDSLRTLKLAGVIAIVRSPERLETGPLIDALVAGGVSVLDGLPGWLVQPARRPSRSGVNLVARALRGRCATFVTLERVLALSTARSPNWERWSRPHEPSRSSWQDAPHA